MFYRHDKHKKPVLVTEYGVSSVFAVSIRQRIIFKNFVYFSVRIISRATYGP